MKVKSKMKTAMAVAAVAALGAFAPAMASANTWSSNGAPFAGPAHLTGNLTTTTMSGAQTTCTVVLKAGLDNGGGVAQGQLQAYLFGAAAGGTCTTSLSNCSVSITVYTPTTRPITTSGANVTFSGIYYVLTYNNSGGTCALNNVPIHVQGSMTGSVPSGLNHVTFSNSPGLTTTLGPATVSGTLAAYAQNGAGGPDLARPITL